MKARADAPWAAPPLADTAVGIGWRTAHFQAVLEDPPARIDFLEVHAENHFTPGGAARAVLLQAREHHALSLHAVGLSLGSVEGLDLDPLERLARLVEEVEPVFVSDHASFARVRDGQGAECLHANDLLPIPWTRPSLDLLVAHVDQVQARLRRRILVENLSACIAWRECEMAEVEFLVSLSRRSGCGLLVDLNNLIVNALNAGVPDPEASVCAWVDEVPPACVEEIHLAGHTRWASLYIDDHGSRVPSSVRRVHEHAIRRWGARPTLVEWDTGLPPLPVLLDEAERTRRALERRPTTDEVRL